MKLFAYCLIAGWCVIGTDCPAENPTLEWEFKTPRALPQAIVVDQHDSEICFVALKEGGVSVLRFRNDAPIQIADLSKRQLGNLDAMHLFLRGNHLFVALGDFFTKEDFAGLAILNISQPERPVVMSHWKTKVQRKGSAHVVVNKERAYLAGMTEGIYVLDIQNPNRIRHMSTYQPDVHFPRKNPSRVQHPNARGLAIRDDLLFVANDAGGLRVLDTSRDQLREVTRYINAKMMGKQQAYNSVILDGQRAFIAVDYAGVEIVDISNPQEIRQIGWWNPWKADTLNNMWFNSPGHANQQCYDPKRNLLYISAGDSELQVIDVRNPQMPRLVSSFGKPKNGLGAWGVTLSENRAYLTYIKTFVPFRGKWSGIRVVELPQ